MNVQLTGVHLVAGGVPGAADGGCVARAGGQVGARVEGRGPGRRRRSVACRRPASRRARVSVKPIVADWTGSLKVAVTLVPAATPVAPGAGVRPVTVGGVVSGAAVVNVQVTGSIWLPAVSLAPLTVAV